MKSMSGHVCVLILISVLLLLSGCQDQGSMMKTQTRTVQSAPKIKFEKIEYNFGEVSTSKKYTGQFTFTNTGNEQLKITEVKKCCGVVAELENDKKDYAPGESGVLNVTYTSGNSTATIIRRLHIVSNDADNPETTLTIKAKIVPKVTYEPRRLEIPMKGKNAGCPPITIRSLDNKPFSIKAFRSTLNSITAEFDPNALATQFVLHPELHTEKLKGRTAGVISIELTHPECPRLSMTFQPIPEFTMTPRSLVVINAEPQKPMVKKFTVRNNYNEDFEIESVTSKNASLVKLLDQKKIDNGYSLDLEITPPIPNEKGIYNDTVNVTFKNGEKLEVNTYIRYAKRSDSAQIQAKK